MQEQPGAKGKRQAVLQQARRVLREQERDDVLRSGGGRMRVRTRISRVRMREERG